MAVSRPKLLLANAIFAGVRPCKNADYAHLLFRVPETFQGGVEIPATHFQEPNLRVLVDASKIANFTNFVANQTSCDLELFVSVSAGDKRPYLNYNLASLPSPKK